MKEIEWADEDGDKGKISDAAAEDRVGKIYIEIRTGSGERRWSAVYLTDEAEEKLCSALNERRAERWIRVLEDFSEQLQKHNKELRELLEDFTELTTTLTKGKSDDHTSQNQAGTPRRKSLRLQLVRHEGKSDRGPTSHIDNVD